MAYTFRAANTSGNNTGSALSVNLPAGVTTGDLLLILAYLESDTNTWVAAPSGYTAVQSGVNTGSFSLSLWYKIAGASESAPTITPTTGSVWRAAVSACWSGGSGSGSFVDVFSSVSQGDSVIESAQSAPSITTTAANDLLVFCYGNFGGTNPTGLIGAATTSATAIGGLTIGYATIASAGSTGTSAIATGIGSQTYAGFHVAFLLTGAGGGGGLLPRMTLLGVG